MSRFFVSSVAILFLAVVPAHRAQAQAPARVQGTTARRAKVEAHPRIHSAIRELQAAKEELQKAPHDFGGHRADAVQAVDRAIEQLRLALQYDKK